MSFNYGTKGNRIIFLRVDAISVTGSVDQASCSQDIAGFVGNLTVMFCAPVIIKLIQQKVEFDEVSPLMVIVVLSAIPLNSSSKLQFLSRC